MGKRDTAQARTQAAKMTQRRRQVRKILGDIPEPDVRALASVPDPVARYQAIVQYSRTHRLSIECQKLCDDALYIVVLNWLKDPEAARQYITGGCYNSPDDRKYRPTHVDSTLRGVGRATGTTAQVIKSRKTVTKWQYQERNQDMATTRALSDDGNVWCTTFFGGKERGRCFTLNLVRKGHLASATFTEQQLMDLLTNEGEIVTDGGSRPGMQ